MKEYVAVSIEIICFKEDVVRTSPVMLPDDEFGDGIGEF